MSVRYDLLLVGNVDPDRLREALAGAFGVPFEEVDVGHEDDQEARIWDAKVFTDYSPRNGDFSWGLSVFVADDVPSPPSEERLSLDLACALATAVLFPPVENIPSLWKVATPRGDVAYARLHEPEHDADLFRVTDVEIPVPELPDATVSRFPDVIKMLHIPTPVVDAHISGKVEGELKKLRSFVVSWERLTVRMVTGWPPFAWYPAEMYEEDLHCRDRVQRLAEAASASGDSSVLDMLSELDVVYREMTLDDGGQALAEACEFSVDALADRAWYWRRRPVDLPWKG